MLSRNYEKNREKSHEQVCRYMDHLGESEGWLVVFDPDFTKPWEEKISTEDIAQNGKTIHVVRC